MSGERGPQGDHGQKGEVGPQGRIGPEGVMLDRFPLALLVVVIIAGFLWLGWHDIQFHHQLEDLQHSVVQLQQPGADRPQ
jgi:hypothetical protein